MLMTAENRIVAFPAHGFHSLDAGGFCSMEIKHSHPQNKSAEERTAQLKDCGTENRGQRERVNERRSRLCPPVG